MAKKNRTNYGSFDLDSEFDFDFDFDDAPKKPRNDGKPISQIMEGVKSSMRDKFTDPSTLKSIIRKALPEGFSQAWDAVETMVDTSQSLYDQATKEIRPQMGSIARKLDTITPDAATKTKKLTRLLRDKLSPELPEEYSSYQTNIEDSSVQKLLLELEVHRTEVSESQQKRTQAREILRDRIQSKQFDQQQKLLGIVANEVMTTRHYLTGFNVQYQKKSLELQYRTYATLAGMANAMTSYMKTTREFQNSLLHNTALPEYAKTSNTQRWKQVTKEQMFGDMNQALFGTNRIAAAGKRLMKRGREKIADYKENFSMIDDLLESVIESNQNAKDMADITGEHVTGYGTAGKLGGGILGEFVEDMIAEKIKNFASKNKSFMKKSFTAGKYAMNPGAGFDRIRNSKWFRSLGADGGEMGTGMKDALSALMGILADERPDMTIKNVGIGQEGENKLHTQMRTARSLNEIIPGYLSRILREISILRTGDVRTPLLTYDSKMGRFKTETKMATDLMDSLKRKAATTKVGRHTYSDSVKEMTESFIGDEKLSASDTADVTKFLAKLSRSTADYDITSDRIMTTPEFKALSPDQQKLVKGLLEKRLSGDTYESAGRQFKFASDLSRTRSSIGNLMGDIQEAIRDGHAEVLEKQGLIKRNDKGDWEVNSEKYASIYDDTIATSDVNAKKNIRPLKMGGRRALNAIRNTRLYKWFYKNGGGEQTGPMAQDVRSNFGDATAPGGKTLDLVNMNGHVMEAVQQLANMIESMGAGDGLKYLKAIEENTRRTAERCGGGSGTGSGSGDANFPNTLWGHISSLIGDTASYAKDATIKGAKTTFDIGSRIGRTGSAASRAAWKASAPMREKAMEMSIEAFKKATNFGARLVTDIIPEGVSTLKGIGSKLFNKLKDIVHRAQDLYVAGRDSPVIEGLLLQAGLYRDQLTGKVLETMDDVAKARGNIIDASGRVVLSAEEKARGVYTASGERLKSFASKAGEVLLGAGALAMHYGNKALGRAKGQIASMAGLGLKVKESVINRKNKISETVREKLSELYGTVGIGGSDPRTVPVLLQIRDLIAIGKRGKRVKEILDRDIGSSPYERKFTRETVQEALDETKEKAKGIFEKAKEFFQGKPEFVGPMPQGSVPNMPGMTMPGDMFGSVKGLFGQGMNAASSLKGAFTSKFPGMAGKMQNSKLGQMYKKWRDGKKPSNPQEAAAMQQFQLGYSPAQVASTGTALATIPTTGTGIGAPRPYDDVIDVEAREVPTRGKWGQRWDRVTNSRLGRFGKLDRIPGMFAGAKSLFSGLGGLGSALGGLFSGNGQQAGNSLTEGGTNQYSAASHAQRLLQLGGSGNYGEAVEGANFNDRNGDGSRDNGAADRMESMAAQRMANEERKAAGIAAGLAAAQAKANRNSPADDAIEKMIKVATAGLGAIASKAGTLMEAAGALGDFFGGGDKGSKKGRGKKGLLRKGWGGAKAVGRGITNVGKGVQGIMRAVPGSAKVARVAMGATRAAQVVGLMGGGAGAMISGSLGLLGAALSSPFVIGAVTIGAVGYGAYKGYKYYTRNDINEYQRFRFMQYGLDGTDATKVFNEKVMALEDYLIDGKLAFEGGVARLNERAIDTKVIADIFGVENGTDTEISRLASWIENRFRIVFLHHVNTLYRINNKASILKVDKLGDEDMFKYLSEAQAPKTVWSALTSPFKGLDVLSGNSGPCEKLIESLLRKVSEKINKKSKEEVKAGGTLPKEGPHATAPIKSALGVVPEHVQKAAPIPVYNNQNPLHNGNNSKSAQSAINSGLAGSDNGGISEDGKNIKDSKSVEVSKSDSSTLAAGSTSGLKMANGPLASGEEGMKYVKLGKGAKLEGMNPAFMKNFLSMAQEYGTITGKPILINQAFRSYQDQERQWRADPSKAARPGNSIHELGMAMDINTGIMNQLEKYGLLKKYGFTRPVGGETWHMEPAGIQASIQKARTDPTWATQAIMDGVGKGGGGYGSIPKKPVGGRNHGMAMALLNAPSAGTVDVAALTTKDKDPVTNSTVASIPSAVVNDTKREGSALTGYASVGRGVSPITSSPEATPTFSGKYADRMNEIAKYAKEAGGDPNQMLVLAAMESDMGRKTTGAGTSAAGPMQFVKATWNEQMGKHGSKYGLEGKDQNDVRASTILATEYMKANNKRIKKAKGGELDIVDSYMGHLLGAGGASRIMRADPNELAINVVDRGQWEANKPTFFNNGKARTVSELRDFLRTKIEKKAKEYGIDLKNHTSSTSETKITKDPGATEFIRKIEDQTKGISAPKEDGDTKVYPEGTLGAQRTKQGLPLYQPKAIATVPKTTGAYGTGVTSSVPIPGTLAAQDAAATTAYGTTYEVPRAKKQVALESMGLRPLDPSIQVTGEILETVRLSSESQLKHLSSIDTNTSAMIDLLEKIVDNTTPAEEGESKGSSSSSSGKDSSKTTPNFRTPDKFKRATPSSFGDSRVIDTI